VLGTAGKAELDAVSARAEYYVSSFLADIAYWLIRQELRGIHRFAANLFANRGLQQLRTLNSLFFPARLKPQPSMGHSDAARFQPSAFSTQPLNKHREHALRFFVKCKEVTDKESMHLDV